MAIDFPNSPTTNQTYTVGATTWTYDGEKWVVTASGRTGPSAVTVSDTAPTSPSYGTFWYNSSNGRTYTYYADANSSQWVEVGSADPTFSTLTTKGDILTRSSSAMTRLGVGTTNQVLAANSAATNGVEWVDRPWNTAWGIVGRNQKTNGIISVTASPQDAVSVSFTAISGRLYYAVANSYIYRSIAGYVTTKFLDGAGNGLQEQTQSCGAGEYGSYMNHLYFTATGSYTIKTSVTADGSGTINFYASASYPHQLIVTDIGPA